MNNYFSSIKGKSIINKLMEFKKIELILLKKLFFKIVLFCFTFLIQINLDASVKSFQEKNRDILREKEKIEKELGSKEEITKEELKAKKEYKEIESKRNKIIEKINSYENEIKELESLIKSKREKHNLKLENPRQEYIETSLARRKAYSAVKKKRITISDLEKQFEEKRKSKKITEAKKIEGFLEDEKKNLIDLEEKYQKAKDDFREKTEVYRVKKEN